MNSAPQLPLIELAGIEKRYGKIKALKVPQLCLKAGENIWLAGGNGSGKSTLLRIVCGISRPTLGTVTRNFDPRATTLGFVPQRGGVYPNLTVGENLRLRMRLYDRADDTEFSAAQTARALGIESMLSTPVTKLSGGYAHLCAIAAMLCVRPDILFLDEPFAGLDEIRSGYVLNLIGAMRSRFHLLVVSDHEQRFVMTDVRTVRLRDGEIVS